MTFPEAFSAMLAYRIVQTEVPRRCKAGSSWFRVRIRNGVLEKQMKWNERWRPYNLDVNRAMKRNWRAES